MFIGLSNAGPLWNQEYLFPITRSEMLYFYFFRYHFYEASPIIGSQKILVMLVVASALDSTRSSWGLVKGLNC